MLKTNAVLVGATQSQMDIGVWLAPDGNCNAELQYLQSIATDCTNKMEKAGLQYNNAAFSLNVLLRKLAYPWLVTNFTEQQCATIMKPVLKEGLPKAGVFWMYPMLWSMYLCYAGLAIPNLYTKQLVTQVTAVPHFGGQFSDTTSTLIQALVKAMQLETNLWEEFLD